MSDARMSPARLPRLPQIEANTHSSVSNEARRMGWGGEVVALDENLRHIAYKNSRLNASSINPKTERWMGEIEGIASTRC